MALERTCVCCRQKDEKGRLLRFVLSADGLVWDRLQRLPGRGAYMHGRPGCWAKMVELRNWLKAFRVSGAEAVGAALQAGLPEVMERVRREVPEIGKARPAGRADASKGKGRIRL